MNYTLTIKAKEDKKILAEVPISKELYDELKEINDPDILQKAIALYFELKD